jgi:predicted transcriptional regulator
VRYRSKTEILVQILEVAKEKSVTKTRIAYDCFLSYDFLNKCLSTLVKYGFLHLDKKTRTYVTTEQGFRYLELCRTLRNYIKFEVNNV